MTECQSKKEPDGRVAIQGRNEVLLQDFFLHIMYAQTVLPRVDEATTDPGYSEGDTIHCKGRQDTGTGER